MRSRNNSTHPRKAMHDGFEQYLGDFRHRFKFKTIATSIAALAFAALVITLAIVVFGERLAYSPVLFIPARIILAMLSIGIIVGLLWLPLRAFKSTAGIAEIEARVPALQGRAETWHDLNQRREHSAFSTLLARDAMRSTRHAPISRLLPAADVYGPFIGALALLAMLAWLFISSPLASRAGIAHLWFGWFKSDILPQRSIALAPGDSKIRYGDSLTVTARTSGFESAYATLYVRETDGEWTELAMTPSADDRSDKHFNFTLYGMTQSIEYYVSSAFTNSDQHQIEVVVPARIESLDLQYHYPQWTGTPAKLVENGSQIAAIAGTKVEILFSTDKPLQAGLLLHDHTDSAVVDLGDNQYRAELIIHHEGDYQLFDVLEGDRIALTEPQSVIVLEDQVPEISFLRPGADWNASPIEEVTVQATAADDFAVESVALHYAVNDSEWKTIELSPDSELQHTFMLEDFAADHGNALIPGDLITYYAEARDRQQAISTDMLFIDVRPFDRRFSQSQQSGQGGGAGQGEQEISQRQKEILVATWNLIREQRENTRTLIKPKDSAILLADLQTTLAEQADTLAKRAEARQLLDDDPDIARFVEYMLEAAVSMRPSAKSLEALDFDEAVKHQQRALQFLKRAESVFNDIQISRNQSEGGGSSDAGRDMAEMYELEMDLAKNQYETPDAAQQSEQRQQDQNDDAFDKLKDLARRQEQLAEAAKRNEELSMAERWQQERLQRELEELQRELQRQQQQQNSQQNGQQQGEQQQSGEQQGGQQQSGQSQQQQGNAESNPQQRDSEQSNENQPNDTQQAELAMQNMQQALEQMRNSTDQQNPNTTRESLENASRELQQSVNEIAEARRGQLQQQLTQASAQTRELTQKQRDTAQQLRDALQRAMQAREQGLIESGLSSAQERRLAEQKRTMQRELEQIRQDLAQTAERFADQTPQTSKRIEQALDELERTKTAELMGITGDMIEEGRAPQAALREQQITDTLTALQNALVESSNLAASETSKPQDSERSLADATRALQQLREVLTEAVQRAQSGNNNPSAEPTSANPGSANPGSANPQSANPGSGDPESSQDNQRSAQAGEPVANNSGQQPSEQAGQGQGQGQGRNQGQASSNRQLAGNAGMQLGGGGISGNSTTRGGQFDNLDFSQLTADTESKQRIEQARENLENSLPQLENQLSAQLQASLHQLANDMKRGPGNGENGRRINREVGILLRQLEQLELALQRNRLEQHGEGIRAARDARNPKGYDLRAADYFRRLSEGLKSGS